MRVVLTMYKNNDTSKVYSAAYGITYAKYPCDWKLPPYWSLTSRQPSAL